MVVDNIDKIFKSSLFVVGGIYSVFVDNFGPLIPVLLVIQLADFATGLIASAKEGKGWASYIGITGFSKKMMTLIIIGLVYLVERNLFESNTLGSAVATVYIGLELLSVTENAGRSGVYIHPKVKRLIAVLKGDEENENK